MEEPLHTSYTMATHKVFALVAGCSAWEAVNYCDGDEDIGWYINQGDSYKDAGCIEVT